MDDELNPNTVPTDEDEALQSLDDTTVRPLPEISAFWEPLETPAQAPVPVADNAAHTRRRTLALVGAVAVVSFMAGGFTARMSAQMPVLFAKAPEPLESTAAFEEPVAVTDTTQDLQEQDSPEQDLQESEPEPTPGPPSYDTGYDTTEHSWGDEDEDGSTGSGADSYENDEPDLRWNLDDQGDRSLSYDNEDQRVTVDYNDHTLTFTLDDLLNSNDGGQRNDYVYTPQPRYDSDTGYDSTDAERDSYGWRGYNGTFGWYSQT